jgi:hypothetical protein
VGLFAPPKSVLHSQMVGGMRATWDGNAVNMGRQCEQHGTAMWATTVRWAKRIPMPAVSCVSTKMAHNKFQNLLDHVNVQFGK